MKFGRLRFAVIGGVVLLVLAACGTGEVRDTPSSAPDSAGPGRLLDPAEFAAAIADPARLTINVHVPFEGGLPDTDLEIPYDEIEAKAAMLPPDRDAPLAVYCKSGRMSADATRTLTRLGYTDVVDLDGGMNAWRDSGRSLVSTRPDG